MSAVTLAVLRVTGGMKFSIGSNVSPMQISATICQLNAPPDDGSSGNGPPVIALNFGSVNSAITVFNSPASGSGGLPPVLLEGSGTGNTLTVSGGNVGFGMTVPGESGAISSLTVNAAPSGSSRAPASRVTLGSGTTLTTINQSGGSILAYGTAPTVVQSGGTFQTSGSGTITTATIGGTGVFNSTGTITTLNVNGSGKADFSQSTAARTVTTATVYGPGASLTADNGSPLSVTFTNGVQCSQGAKSNQINLGTVKVSQS